MLSALLILILVSSHGTMGLAAPHHDGSAHALAGHHDHGQDFASGDVHDASGLSEAADAGTQGDESTDDASDSVNAAHAHAVSDQAPASFALPEPFPAERQDLSSAATKLASAPPAQLLEPPSA